ncbi:MAG: hypothetical protein ACI8PZ_005806 [Myxococcota bacterium]|jgi:hypothetical protein
MSWSWSAVRRRRPSPVIQAITIADLWVGHDTARWGPRARIGGGADPLAVDAAGVIPSRHGVCAQGRVVAASDRRAIAPAVLRAPQTNFEGRDVLLTRLLQHVRGRPGLWTLTGPGGVGKTRLSQELGARVALDGGSLFCDLHAVTTSAEISVALGRTLQLAAQRLADVDAATTELCDRGALLLILDHGEHIVEPLAEVVHALRRGAPEARILVTSRLRLGRAATLGVQIGPESAAATAGLVRALGGCPSPSSSRHPACAC